MALLGLARLFSDQGRHPVFLCIDCTDLMERLIIGPHPHYIVLNSRLVQPRLRNRHIAHRIFKIFKVSTPAHNFRTPHRTRVQ